MIHRIGVFLSALFFAGLIALACSSCLLRPKTPPKEALGNLVKTYLDDSQRLFEIGSPLAYSLFEPLMLLDGERAAVLILAPAKNVSSGITTDVNGEIKKVFSSAFAPDLQSPAKALSDKLETTAKRCRVNLARGNRMAIVFITPSMDKQLNKSRRVYVSKEYLLPEDGFQKAFGKKPSEQYSVEYMQSGKWRISQASTEKEVFLADAEVDSYINKNGPPWDYTILDSDKSLDGSTMRFLQVKVFGINHQVVPLSDVLVNNKSEVAGIFTRPKVNGNSFITGEDAVKLLSEILPQTTNVIGSEEAYKLLFDT